MNISATKSRKEEAEAGLSNDSRQMEITTPNFVLYGETFTFIETFSATVINSDPGNGQIWVKTNAGDEKQISDYGIPFRSSHTIHKYELRHYSKDDSYDAYKDALIVNEKTGEHEVKLKRKTIVIPAFLTMLFHTTSTVSYYRAMPVPKVLTVIFILLCAAALISFLTLPWGFKDGYMWSDHKYIWFTYLFSRIGSFICIKLMKRRSQRFENELRNLINSVKR
ncbi:hypothetical protein RJQ11_24150 [Klebsiella pneumoniae]|uniref:hypothetical protein n=1 Tax=Klebsiella pneumoniae TaxID=573 RepID=UPI0005058698|nr:hypothetical protein [Klebsiella pneumoniae]KGB15654.1 hypothetical protein KPPR1_26095 [Klebsiella pneumoniae]MDC7858764.1 hypothetical protein [Klebsiella pneumoniae]MDW5542863.1 hypothetical protein [Klebsiella pneumoniae]ODO68314.1 hypothetical protein BAY44_24900 [Klebsiella pneumoniae]QPW32562.1 hypothetical protein IT767_16750 [Klebsiella pneumoniae subsp. pneumoniae ATCC 43816]